MSMEGGGVGVGMGLGSDAKLESTLQNYWIGQNNLQISNPLPIHSMNDNCSKQDQKCTS